MGDGKDVYGMQAEYEPAADTNPLRLPLLTHPQAGAQPSTAHSGFYSYCSLSCSLSTYSLIRKPGLSLLQLIQVYTVPDPCLTARVDSFKWILRPFTLGYGTPGLYLYE